LIPGNLLRRRRRRKMMTMSLRMENLSMARARARSFPMMLNHNLKMAIMGVPQKRTLICVNVVLVGMC
jgi:hypothetical protein